MITIENTEVFGWEAAIRGMRNALNSWDNSDSFFWVDGSGLEKAWGINDSVKSGEFRVSIGEKDNNLMQRLSKAGSDHGKFLRMINVTCDIVAPLYWWKEASTYRVGVTMNSCSTMHKIHAKEFTLDDFSHEHLLTSWEDEDLVDYNYGEYLNTARDVLDWTIYALNTYRSRYLETKDKKYWWQLIQLLPSSYNQRRTVQMNYQVLKNMYFARKNHKLDEWREFCTWCETLPYFKEVCVE